MDENQQNQADSTPSPEDATADSGKSRFAFIKIGAFVVSIVLVECVAAYFVLPSPSEVQAMTEARLDADGNPIIIVDDSEEVEEQAKPANEVDLGKFSVTAYQPTSNTTLRIDFHLFGTVLDEDKSDFEERFERKKRRFRDRVIVTVRSSEISDLTDAGLGLIKRKILERTNKELGKPLLQSVIFSDFAFTEQ